MNLKELTSRFPGPDDDAAREARRRWDSLAKPVGSLGLMEEVLVRMAALTGDADVRADRRRALVFCADNGIALRGVASTPSEVTALMARLIAQGRSSVGLMARCAGADVLAVDMGMFTRAEDVRDLHIASGTADITLGPAMTPAQAAQALETGIRLVRESRNEGYDILCTGEMGIGNTTTASAMASVLLGQNPEAVTGRGAGLDDRGLALKRELILKAISVNRPDPSDAMDVLAKLGGFDIAAMAGAFIGGALFRVPVIIDGVISAVAALTAERICPGARHAMLASHMSAEPAAAMALAALGLKPMLSAGMRLGEGTGAVALLPLIDMALETYRGLPRYDALMAAPGGR